MKVLHMVLSPPFSWQVPRIVDSILPLDASVRGLWKEDFPSPSLVADDGTRDGTERLT
jgi:hypothetical protein